MQLCGSGAALLCSTDLLRNERSPHVLQTRTCPTAQGSTWEVLGSPKHCCRYCWCVLLLFFWGFFKRCSSQPLQNKNLPGKIDHPSIDRMWIYSMLNPESLRQAVWWVLTNHTPSTNQFLIHDRMFCFQSAVISIWQNTNFLSQKLFGSQGELYLLGFLAKPVWLPSWISAVLQK